MGIAITLQQHLDAEGVQYDCVEHKRTNCTMRSAEVSHVAGDSVAKAVVLKRRDSFILAVVPASRQVRLDGVGDWLHQPVSLATELEFAPLFPDCQPGAVPAVAAAYHLRSLVDESLERNEDIYFEGGDHRTLVHLSREAFHRLMRTVPHGHFCAEPESADVDGNYGGA